MSRRKPGKRFAAGIGLVLVVLLGVYLVTGREKLASWYERWKLLRDETAWETFGGHRYMMTPEPGNWYDAEQYARWLGGHLVKVDDAPEQDWLVETFGRSKPFWIGCTDRTVEGTWTWSDGQPLSFTNWFPGEPSNGDGWNDVPEHFAVMNNRNPGKWNDLGESASVSGIIELGDCEIGGRQSSRLKNPVPHSRSGTDFDQSRSRLSVVPAGSDGVSGTPVDS